MSLDGFIGGPGGDMSWLTEHRGVETRRAWCVRVEVVRVELEHVLVDVRICIGNGKTPEGATRAAARGTFGAHQREISPEAMRTAEISSAGQGTCAAYRQTSGTCAHKTRPTGRLAPLRGEFPCAFCTARMPGVRRRIELWLRMLETGAKPLDTMARWIAVVTLLLGIGGITVTFVLQLPWPLIVIILMGVLLAVVLEGAYLIWYATDQERLSAEAERDAAQQEFQTQQRAHEEQIASLRALQSSSSPRSGLEVVITNEVATPFPGRALILEIEYTVTNHDAMEHMLSMGARGPLFFPPVDKQGDPEYLEILQTYGRISERRRREAPPRVRPGETVRGVYVVEFTWNPARYLPDYSLVVSDGRQEYEVRPRRIGTHPQALEPTPLQGEEGRDGSRAHAGEQPS